MIGNRVKIITAPVGEGPQGMVTGTLKRLDVYGAVIWRESSLPEQECDVFMPMRRIIEIIDLGRAL